MTTPPPYLVEDIKSALATDERVGELGIVVEIVGDEVFLRGSVATEARRAAITEVAEECCPELRVHNETEVENLQEPGAMENLS